MKTKLLSTLLLAASVPLGTGLMAQTTAPTLTAGSPTNSTVQNQTAPAPSQTIYGPSLPSAQQLTDAAARQGIAIDQISQTAGQVVVTYRYADGQFKTVSYQLLPAGSGPGAPQTVVAAPSSPAPTVVYQTVTPPPVVYYYDDYPGYYYPRYVYGYPRVSLNLGVGFGRGYYGGGGFYHGGGFHRGWR
jgi:hypothetical protein